MGIAMVNGGGTMAGAPCSYAMRGSAMLLIADGAGPFDTAIARAGGRLIRRVPWSAAADTLPRIAGWPVLVIEATGIADDRLDETLPILAQFIVAAVAPAVVALTADQIDLVAGHLLGPDVRLLCAPTMDERVAALQAAAAPPLPTLHADLGRTVEEPPHDGYRAEGPRPPLTRLNDRVAEIARLVSDLSRDVHQATGDIADRRPGYEAEPGTPAFTTSVRAQEVRRIIAIRQKRGVFFGQFGGEALFEDPAWEMLLDLYAAELEGTRVSVSSLCIAAGVAPTTALRWITKMTEMALLVRHPDPVDRRRAFMALSPRASEAMRGYMVAVRKM